MVFEKVKEIIVDELGVEEEEVKLESNLQEDLDADSLDIVQLAMEIEEAFDIQISAEDQKKIKTVQDIVTYVNENK
jgi:acyl carrier protein